MDCLVIRHGSSRTILTGGTGGDTTYYGGTAFSSHIFRTLQSGLNYEKLQTGQIGIGGTAYGNGDVLKSNGSGGSVYWGTSSGADPNSTFDTVDVVGIVTAGSFVTDLIPSNGTGRGFCTRYYITASVLLHIVLKVWTKRHCRKPYSLLDERFLIYV